MSTHPERLAQDRVTLPATGNGSPAGHNGVPGDLDLAAGVARALTEADPTAPPATVHVTGVASAGATRRTVFVDIVRGGSTTEAVAQLAPTLARSLSPTAEAACVRQAAAVGVPVAEPLVATDDVGYLGVPFLVSRRVGGRTVPRQILRAVAERPGLGTTLARQCGETLAALHGLDPAGLPGDVSRLVDPTPTVAYTEHLRSVAASLAPSPVMALGQRWLARHHPEAAKPCLVHGDMRNGNLIVDDDGLAAVVDWELAHVGDAMEDLAWLCLRCWRFRADHLEVGGFASLTELSDAYEKAGGTWRPDAFHWWKVARTMWWCLVLQLQAEAFAASISSSLVLAASGRRVAELEYDLLMLIRPGD